MSHRCVGRFAPGTFVLRLAMWLAAAFLAAVVSHVAIDVAGDVLLAHDTYDDHAHGSRLLASVALVASVLVALALWARAMLAETRGLRGALLTALRASVPLSGTAFGVRVAAGALPMVLGMAWLDAFCAGMPIDDARDLLGGSLPLGVAVTLTFALAIAIGIHRFVALVTRFQGSIVRVVGALLYAARFARGPICTTLRVHRSEDRPRVPAALARCTGADRAPPETAFQKIAA